MGYLKIKQGESYPVYITLNQDGKTLLPEMIGDLKVCIGSDFSKTYSAGGVKFDAASSRWYIHPTQEETMKLPHGRHKVTCHVKYGDGTILIADIGFILVEKSCCGEVF